MLKHNNKSKIHFMRIHPMIEITGILRQLMKLRGNTQFFFPANKKEQEAASARFDPRTR